MITDSDRRGAIPTALLVVLGVAIAGVVIAIVLAPRWRQQPAEAPVLTQEARVYVRAGNLKLSEVNMGAKENFAQQMLVEITGKITNAGDRTVKLVEINCVFSDPAGLVVLKERLPIVGGRTGSLKPGETKTFRLPFDTIPPSWNQALPQLVIAQIVFG
jgi:hypothetical protein